MSSSDAISLPLCLGVLPRCRPKSVMHSIFHDFRPVILWEQLPTKKLSIHEYAEKLIFL